MVNLPENEMAVASSGFCVFRNLLSSDIDKRYLLWILTTDYALLQMLQRSSGGNYPAIAPDELAKIVIPIPDYSVQIKICEEVDNIIKQSDQLKNEAFKSIEVAKAKVEKILLEGSLCG